PEATAAPVAAGVRGRPPRRMRTGGSLGPPCDAARRGIGSRGIGSRGPRELDGHHRADGASRVSVEGAAPAGRGSDCGAPVDRGERAMRSIGIDLGTTHSVASHVLGGRPVVIHYSDDKDDDLTLLPSAVSRAAAGEFLYGYTAL